MTKTRGLTTFLPSVLMAVITFVSFSDINLKGLFVISLLLVFPLLFLGQGVACGLGKGNIVIALLTSITTFLLILLLFLNSSALIYIFLYLFVGLFGFVLAFLSQKGRQKFSNN